MALYFQLTRVGEQSASPLSRVDEELCRYLGEPVHEDHYVHGWVDTVGYLIATGRNPQDCIGQLHKHWVGDVQPWLEIVDYLRSHYEWNGWPQRH
jgi:hypothetical protein